MAHAEKLVLDKLNYCSMYCVLYIVYILTCPECSVCDCSNGIEETTVRLLQKLSKSCGIYGSKGQVLVMSVPVCKK